GLLWLYLLPGPAATVPPAATRPAAPRRQDPDRREGSPEPAVAAQPPLRSPSIQGRFVAAAEEGRRDQLETLLRQGAVVNTLDEGRYALCQAAYANQLEIAT